MLKLFRPLQVACHGDSEQLVREALDLQRFRDVLPLQTSLFRGLGVL